MPRPITTVSAAVFGAPFFVVPAVMGIASSTAGNGWAHVVPDFGRLTEEFEAKYLSRFDQLPGMNDEQLVAFLAEAHVEFILIHPFREGNPYIPVAPGCYGR